MFGIHWLGLFNELNQPMPKLTNIEPKTATTKIGRITDNNFKNVSFLIIKFYAKKNTFILFYYIKKRDQIFDLFF